MYHSLQICRALAALMVVCFHVSGNLHRDRYMGAAAEGIQRLFSFGDAGVPFFFVLSGFIVTWVHWRDFHHPERLGRYLFKRASRIYPVYWLVFALAYAAAWLTPGLRDTLPQDAATLVKSLLLIPQDKGITGGTGAPVLFVAWTLQYEMAFYAVMALAIVRPALLMLPVALFALNLWGQAFGTGVLQDFFANPRVFLFALGVGVAGLARSAAPLPHARVWAVAFACGFASLAGLEVAQGRQDWPIDAVLLYGGVSAGLVWALVRSEDQGVPVSPSSWMARLGDASYALYLLHVPVMSLLCKSVMHLGLRGPAGAWAALGLVVAGCCVTALAFHVWLERPMTQWIGQQWRVNTSRLRWI